MAADDLADVKVVDFAILSVAQTTRKGAKVVGTFPLLARPLRIQGCRLVLAPGGSRFVVWLPSGDIRIAQRHQEEVAETARHAFIEAQKRVAA